MLTRQQIAAVSALKPQRSSTSYFGGGAVLHANTPVVPDDIDIVADGGFDFDDVVERDLEALQAAGFQIVEGTILRGGDEGQGAHVTVRALDGTLVYIDWTGHLTPRLWPLQPSPLFGIAANPLDVATDKVMLALSGCDPLPLKSMHDIVLLDLFVAPLEHFIKDALKKLPMYRGVLPPDVLLDEFREAAMEAAETMREIGADTLPGTLSQYTSQSVSEVLLRVIERAIGSFATDNRANRSGSRYA